MDDYAWVLRGSQRRHILRVMDKEKIPSMISKDTKISLNNTSDILRELVKHKLALCLNEEAKTGRIYKLTKKGALIREKLIE